MLKDMDLLPLTDEDIKKLREESVTGPLGGVNLKNPMPDSLKPEEMDDKLNIKKMIPFI